MLTCGHRSSHGASRLATDRLGWTSALWAPYRPPPTVEPGEHCEGPGTAEGCPHCSPARCESAAVGVEAGGDLRQRGHWAGGGGAAEREAEHADLVEIEVTAERAAGVDCGKGVHDGGDVADSSCDRLGAEAIGCCGVAAVVEAA